MPKPGWDCDQGGGRVNFSHSEERRIVEETLTRWLRDHYQWADRDTSINAAQGFNRAAWRELGALGIIATLVPEAHGGFGGRGYDIALVFEALGRVLAVEPWLSSGLLGARLIAECEKTRPYLPDVLSGETLVAVAHGEPGGGYEASYVTTRAEPVGDHWQLSGHKAVVLNGDAATHFIVSARIAGGDDDVSGISLFFVDAAAPGVSRRAYATIDGLRASELELQSVEVAATQLMTAPGAAFELIERALAAAALAVCAEAMGAMETALDMTLDYLRTREQFGQPIGKFQALQHRMVDVATAIEQSRSLVIKAASVMEASRDEREVAVSAAKHYLGNAARLVAEEATQMHGGIGLAKETPISHYVKRLVMIDHMFGDTDHHLSRYIAMTR